MLKFVEINSHLSKERQTKLLEQLESLHRQLRPTIPAPYQAYMRKMLQEGARVTVLTELDRPLCCAVWRVHHTTFHGIRFYVDDLVTDEQMRGKTLGKQMLDWLQARAKQMNADTFDLESGVQRGPTHRFYFREGLTIFALSFTRPISDRFL